MKLILRELKKTGAKIIFATSTPVSDEKGELCGPMPPAHRNEDIIKYNKAVLKAFAGEDVVINDLFSHIYPKKEEYLSNDMIHPNEKGIKLLGGIVANIIKGVGVHKNTNVASQCTSQLTDEKNIQ